MTKKENAAQFVKFCLVGGSNALVSLAVYSALVYVGAHYMGANFFAFALSVLNAFFWSDKFVFKKDVDERRNPFLTLAKTYATYGLTGVLLQSFFLFLFIDKLHVNKYFAQILCIAINLPLNFVLNKFWSFKTVKMEGEE